MLASNYWVGVQDIASRLEQQWYSQGQVVRRFLPFRAYGTSAS